MQEMEAFQARFADECAGACFLRADESLTNFLQVNAFLQPSETIQNIAKAGEGNMNLTLRVTTNRRTFIVKQARPWVEKYPQLDAPWDRALSEAKFYELVENVTSVAAKMPRLLFVDRQSRILVMEDLGKSGDYSSLYGEERLQAIDRVALATYLTSLHHLGGETELTNHPLRQLNHAHIFQIPFQPDNGLDLDSITPGLGRIGSEISRDVKLRDRATDLGKIYLSDGPTLLHGDFYPGSWLHHPTGLKVIDPEFAHFGRAEFELGVLQAHFALTRHSDWPDFLENYVAPDGFDTDLMNQFAGVEIIRRLLGYAQLPLVAGLEQKSKWLDRALQWLR